MGDGVQERLYDRMHTTLAVGIPVVQVVLVAGLAVARWAGWVGVAWSAVFAPLWVPLLIAAVGAIVVGIVLACWAVALAWFFAIVEGAILLSEWKAKRALARMRALTGLLCLILLAAMLPSCGEIRVGPRHPVAADAGDAGPDAP